MSIYSDIGLTTSESVAAAAAQKANSNKNATTLSQTDFLSLLTTELAYQDPTNPTDNNQMVTQLSQISTVDGINSLNNTVTGLSDMFSSSQALQVSGLVGKNVLMDQNNGYSDGTGFAGVINAGDDGATDITISVLDQAGTVVYQAAAEGTFEGNVPFAWDGCDSSGNRVPEGYYTVMANALVKGESSTVGAQVYGKVQSVVLGNKGAATSLNIVGFGNKSLSEILEVAS